MAMTPMGAGASPQAAPPPGDVGARALVDLISVLADPEKAKAEALRLVQLKADAEQRIKDANDAEAKARQAERDATEKERDAEERAAAAVKAEARALATQKRVDGEIADKRLLMNAQDRDLTEREEAFSADCNRKNEELRVREEALKASVRAADERAAQLAADREEVDRLLAEAAAERDRAKAMRARLQAALNETEEG